MKGTADEDGPAAPPPPPGRALRPEAPTKASALRRIAELARTVPDAAAMVILGDSLAAGWPPEPLRAALGGRDVFRSGIPGERIQQTLWRLAARPAAHLRPEHVLVLLGTNNLGDGDPVERIAEGLAEVAAAVRRLWGAPAIHLVTLPWRDQRPTFREAERRRLNGALLPTLAGAAGLRLVDADAALGAGPAAAPNLLPDLLHLGPRGYEALTRAVLASLERPAATATS